MFFNKAIFLATIAGFLVTQAYADVPDTDQNSGSNNIAYDLPNKWYMGVSFGYTLFLADTMTINSQSETLNGNGFNFGMLGGYKFNDYVALEMNIGQLGHITNSSNSSFTYDARVDNPSIDLLGSYPVFSGYHATTSIFVQAGYGIAVTSYSSNTQALIGNASTQVTGSYNAGIGLNIDLRSNISVRVSDSYVQANYALVVEGSDHGANVLTLALYYNF